MDKNLLEELKRDLEKERTRLEKELSSFAEKDPKMTDDWDAKFPVVSTTASALSHSSQEEQADIREEYESELAQEQTLELRLREVNQALSRIEKAAYGLCRTCGKPISEERLRANPAAECDIEHQPRG